MISRRASSFIRRFAVISVLAAMSVAFIFPVISTGNWFSSHEHARYPYLLEMFRDSFLHGNWYPRWLPNLVGGYGYPTFVFYQPGVFYFALPFTFPSGDPVHALYYALFCMLFIGGFGAYRLARLYCDSLSSAMCVLMFYTTPYMATDFFWRGDLSELFAMQLCPWAAYFLIIVADDVRNRDLSIAAMAALTGATFLIIITHPFIALYCIPVAYLLILGKYAEHHYDYRIIVVTALCLLTGIILGCPYWLTVFQLKDSVTSAAGLLWDPVPVSPAGWFSDGFYNPGIAHIIAAATGFAYAIRKPFFRYVLGAWLLLLFMLSDYSAVIWKDIAFLRYTQFVWRINSVAATLQYMGIIQCAALISMVVQRIPRPALRFGIWIAIGIAVLLIRMFNIHFGPHSAFYLSYRFPYRSAPLDYAAYKRTEEKHLIFMSMGEFNPVNAHFDSLPNRITDCTPVAKVMPPVTDAVIRDNSFSPYVTDFTVTYPDTDKAVSLVINQWFFPGWKVMVNGIPARFLQNTTASGNEPIWRIGDHGRIGIQLPHSGTYEVEAWYDGPPGWEKRNAIMAALLVVSCLLLHRQYKAISEKK